MTQQAECTIEQYVPLFAERMNVTADEADRYLNDLYNDAGFLSYINAGIKDVPEFSGKQFQSVSEMRVYRVMLYLITRILKPKNLSRDGRPQWHEQRIYTPWHGAQWRWRARLDRSATT